jgi:hypothetical protein
LEAARRRVKMGKPDVGVLNQALGASRIGRSTASTS